VLYHNHLLHQQAIAYAAQLRDSKIILIDGQKLAHFMIEHDVGVSVKETFHLKRLDEDFFVRSISNHSHFPWSNLSNYKPSGSSFSPRLLVIHLPQHSQISWFRLDRDPDVMC
jgi:hypothetical protein